MSSFRNTIVRLVFRQFPAVVKGLASVTLLTQIVVFMNLRGASPKIQFFPGFWWIYAYLPMSTLAFLSVGIDKWVAVQNRGQVNAFHRVPEYLLHHLEFF
ncbi:MAG: hypothetical protein R3C03_17605 [Pirellulaceae bacterium]